MTLRSSKNVLANIYIVNMGFTQQLVIASICLEIFFYESLK